jgi:hypothetical protein
MPLCLIGLAVENIQEDSVSVPTAALSALEIAASRAWYPLEPAGSGLERLGEAAYRRASFLDRRILEWRPALAVVSAGALASAARSQACPWRALPRCPGES